MDLMTTTYKAGWGAAKYERDLPLPGDELVDAPSSQVTRAITIDAPVEQVWPWVIQLGADRGGFYSYDWLENLFLLGIHSAPNVVPEWQTRKVGDLVHADRRGRGGWYVMEVLPEGALVLKMADPKHGRPASSGTGFGMEFLWTFVLLPVDHDKTRLLVRERTRFATRAVRLLMAPIGAVSSLMTRKMLLGIKRRAETAARECRGGAQAASAAA